MSRRQDARKEAARLVCIGFDGTAVPDDAAALLRRGVSSVILFARNAGSVDQVGALCRDLKGSIDHPVLIAVDQEGGDVQRLRDGFTAIPTQREIGARANPTAATAIARTIARELRGVSIDMNLAPVLDVDTNPANPVIGERSFSPDPEVVTRLGCATIDGFQSAGVAACAKHFPGHGDTRLDSHHDLPVLPHPLERLEAVELAPFRAAVRAGVAAIMTAHVVFEALDPERPATLSPPVVDGLLRRRLGFDGVVISDDLEMKAIVDRYPIGEAAVAAVTAGVDLLLVCHSHDRQEEAIDGLARAITDGAIPEQRVASAHRRLDRLFDRFVVS